jgi:hypothetical protein
MKNGADGRVQTISRAEETVVTAFLVANSNKRGSCRSLRGWQWKKTSSGEGVRLELKSK